LVGSILPEILPDWLVVHQCGRPTKEVNYASILTRQKKRLSKDLQMNYFIKEWLDESDLFWLYRQAFGSISRAGANTTQELAVVGLPAILIPLPHAHGDEQTKNAEWLVNAGGAILLDQSVLQAESLIESLEKLKVLAQPMRENLSKVTLPKNAAEKLYLVAKELV
jgi:UDP-N-acetylglucosamine--N-acetylmuramyl-(pentapeptide) pyrophosphoryl-undecaprenol N-acetylglucosamine transferase